MKTKFRTWSQSLLAVSLVLTAFLPNLDAQPANCALACSDAQVSLDEDCMAVITVPMIAADTTQCPDGEFVVHVLTLGGDTIPTSPIVTEEQIGQQLIAVLLDVNSGQSCWSYIYVEDKKKPTITCDCPDVGSPDEADPDCIVNCLDAIVYPEPIVEDNCSDNLQPILLSETVEAICHPDFIRKLTRLYTAVDESGNHADTCEQVLWLERIDFDLIEWPDSLTVLGGNALECDYPFLDANGDMIPDAAPVADGGAGVPTIDGVPIFPDFINECNAQVLVPEDIIIGPVGCVKKIMRMWQVFEWHCQGENDTLYIQLIEIVDNDGPNLECPDDVTVTTTDYDCMAIHMIPVPDAPDNCNSTIQISVSYPGGFTDNLLNTGPVFVELPVGDNVITYTAYDECYNSTQCEWIVTVQDWTPPVPLCDEHTVISLTTDGIGGLTLAPAWAFDDGSYDECGAVTFDARRMASCIDFDWTTAGGGIDQVPNGEINYADYGTINYYTWIPFACCDVDAGPIMVELRVTDESGNKNYCMVEVEVQDKIGPFIECPPDITVSCDFAYDLTNLSIFGTVRTSEEDREEICIFDPTNPAADDFGFICVGLDGLAEDNCDVTVTETFVEDVNNCGVGHILRTFTATDPAGRQISCPQEIWIENYHPFYINDINCNNLDPNDGIIWPCDVDVTGCGTITDPEATGFPIIFDDECDLIGYNYEDQVFEFVQGACLKILRTWQVIDWCQFEASSQSPSGYVGFWEFQQVIKVLDDEDPVFDTEQPDISICNEFDCDDIMVELIQDAHDDCTPDNEMRWSYGIDLNNDGTIDDDDSGPGTHIDASRFFPIGFHRVIYSFEDNCGNITTREQYVEVLACKPPTPICLNGLSADLMPVDLNNDGEADWGMITIWASDFDKGSLHACGYPVTVSFSPDTTDKSMVFTCDDLGVQFVEIWVTDLVLGEQAFCQTFIDIQDNMEVCPSMGGGTGIIGGVIETESVERVKDVMVGLEGSNFAPAMTSGAGQYAFSQMPFGGAYTVKPSKNNDWKNGVSTLDLIRIQKHLLGLDEITSPYKMIAADANKSGTVTAVDILMLRKLILGVITEIPDNTSWRFVDAGYTFINPANPFDENFPEVYHISPFSATMADVNFVGIKVGDLNNSVTANAQPDGSGASSSLAVQVSNQDLQPGQSVSIPFLVDGADDLMGYQFTLNFDPTLLQFESVTSPSGQMSEDNFGLHRTAEGIITTSWSDTKAISEDVSAELFVVNFRAVRGGQLNGNLWISSELTKAEAYNAEGVAQEVQLTIEDADAARYDFALLQNTPNPFDKNTTISFTLPEADRTTVTVFDVTGRIIYEQQLDGVAGYNEVMVEAADLRSSGVLYYQVNTQEFSATRKMIRLQ